MDLVRARCLPGGLPGFLALQAWKGLCVCQRGQASAGGAGPRGPTAGGSLAPMGFPALTGPRECHTAPQAVLWKALLAHL